MKTRGSGTLGVAGILCLILGLRQGSTGAEVTDGHSGHKSDPFVAVLTPAAKGLTPMAVNVTPVVMVLPPPLVSLNPVVKKSDHGGSLSEALIYLNKSNSFSIIES